MVIRGHQRSSEVISGHRAYSDPIERRDERLILLSMSSMQLDQHEGCAVPGGRLERKPTVQEEFRLLPPI